MLPEVERLAEAAKEAVHTLEAAGYAPVKLRAALAAYEKGKHEREEDYTMFAARSGNEISYLYYCTLRELGRTDVQRVMHRNGAMFYYTYHLT